MTRAQWQGKRLSVSAQYQHRNQAAGRCRHCTEPLAPGSIAHCVRHVLLYRSRNRARAKSSAWIPGGPGRPPLVLP